jgi:mono/diheme cytochrome c family protein
LRSIVFAGFTCTSMKRWLGIGAAALALGHAPGASGQATERSGPMQSGQHASQPTAAAPVPAAGAASAVAFDAKQLFATVCGWCHSSGGREPGKGPKLMGSALTDAELAYRIKAGKTGQMPAFASSLNDQQVATMVAYIRSLKPEGGQ